MKLIDQFAHLQQKSSQVNFNYLTPDHKSQIFLKGLYNQNSIQLFLSLDPQCGKLMIVPYTDHPDFQVSYAE